MDCTVCGSANAKKCSACGSVAYCCINCQRKDWSKHKFSCKSWKVTTDEENPQFGRFMVANRKIKSGEIIFREFPAFIGPTTNAHDHIGAQKCVGCFGKLGKCPKECLQCRVPICHEKCAKSDGHQLDCQFFSGNGGNILKQDHSLLSPVRFLGMKMKNPKLYQKLTTLVSHRKTKMNGFDKDNLKITSEKILEIVSSENDEAYSMEEIEEAICILGSNAFRIECVQTGEFMCGLYFNAAMINHRCFKANSRQIFGKNYEMKVLAINDIEAGEEITNNYLEPFSTLIQRKAILLRGKCFQCTCQRCCDPTDFGTHASSARCQKCPKGYIVSTDSHNLSAHHECTVCKSAVSGKQVMEQDNSLKLELSKVNRNNLSNIEKFIEVYSPILSENHVFILQLKMWLIEGLNRLPYNNAQCQDILLKKISLIKEIIRGMAPFEAPYSYINGLLHLELTDTIIQKLFSMFSQTIENLNQVPLDPIGLIQEAQNCIEIAEKVFKNEDASSQDHSLKMKICELKVSLLNFSTSIR